MENTPILLMSSLGGSATKDATLSKRLREKMNPKEENEYVCDICGYKGNWTTVWEHPDGIRRCKICSEKLDDLEEDGLAESSEEDEIVDFQ